MSKNFITILVLTLLTVLGWVSFEIYRSATTTTIPLTTQELMSPLNPNFDQELIQKLKSEAKNN